MSYKGYHRRACGSVDHTTIVLFSRLFPRVGPLSCRWTNFRQIPGPITILGSMTWKLVLVKGVRPPQAIFPN